MLEFKTEKITDRDIPMMWPMTSWVSQEPLPRLRMRREIGLMVGKVILCITKTKYRLYL